MSTYKPLNVWLWTRKPIALVMRKEESTQERVIEATTPLAPSNAVVTTSAVESMHKESRFSYLLPAAAGEDANEEEYDEFHLYDGYADY